MLKFDAIVDKRAGICWKKYKKDLFFKYLTVPPQKKCPVIILVREDLEPQAIGPLFSVYRKITTIIFETDANFSYNHG